APVGRLPRARRERSGRDLLVRSIGRALHPAPPQARPPPPRARSVRGVERRDRAPHDAVFPEIRAPRHVRRLPYPSFPRCDLRLRARRPGRAEELSPPRSGNGPGNPDQERAWSLSAYGGGGPPPCDGARAHPPRRLAPRRPRRRRPGRRSVVRRQFPALRGSAARGAFPVAPLATWPGHRRRGSSLVVLSRLPPRARAGLLALAPAGGGGPG